jgi:colanic acid/amylovoran biosynthesis protein
MKRILIEHFQSLDNYGTGMMGLVTVQALADRYGTAEVEFHCDFADAATLEAVRRELRGDVRLYRHEPADYYTASITNIWGRRLHRLFHLFFSPEGRGFDRLIVLGGDDISEYYSKIDPCVNLFKKWESSFLTRVILLGQTLGPFSTLYNQLAVRYLMPRLEVYARDRVSVDYLRDNFRVNASLSADLAFADLPLQGDRTIESAVLERYGLERDGYFTVVVSAGQRGGKYYCQDAADYLDCYRDIIGSLAQKEALADKKIVLLAHTFGRYGDETEYVRKLYDRLPGALKERTVPVTDKIFQTRARFVLGNGLFTVTGRMHAAVSTFQMGRPAVCLSYSTKFRGVIGGSLGQDDLVIEADDNALWHSRRIVALVCDRVDQVLAEYKERCERIGSRVKELQRQVAVTLDEISSERPAGRKPVQ